MIAAPAPAARPELSVVIPCYNEELNVRPICSAVVEEAEKHAKTFEVVFIDNASSDRTRNIIREICAEDSRIRAIFNTRNFGQMRSPTYAIYQAEGEAVIAMCADFQDPPALIGEMVNQWRAGAQIVMGQRRSERASLPLRLARGAGYRLLSMFADYPVINGATGFGLYDRQVVDMLASWNEPEPFFRGMAVESGFRIALLPFDRPPRAAGETKNNYRTLFNFALSGLAGSSRALLRLPLVLSIYLAIISAALFVVTVVRLALHGYSPLLIGLTVGLGMFALLLMFIGLIGDQVRLLVERSRNVPLVMESERVNFPPDRLHPAGRTYVRPRGTNDG